MIISRHRAGLAQPHRNVPRRHPSDIIISISISISISIIIIIIIIIII